ncbi:MAG: hypothetical protein AAFZ65_09315, partial [Planctomycetota bacterium]
MEPTQTLRGAWRTSALLLPLLAFQSAANAQSPAPTGSDERRQKTGPPTLEADGAIPHGPSLWVTPAATDTYVARGTLPLPAGYKYDPLRSPFALMRDGQLYPTQ